MLVTPIYLEGLAGRKETLPKVELFGEQDPPRSEKMGTEAGTVSLTNLVPKRTTPKWTSLVAFHSLCAPSLCPRTCGGLHLAGSSSRAGSEKILSTSFNKMSEPAFPALLCECASAVGEEHGQEIRGQCTPSRGNQADADSNEVLESESAHLVYDPSGPILVATVEELGNSPAPKPYAGPLPESESASSPEPETIGFSPVTEQSCQSSRLREATSNNNSSLLSPRREESGHKGPTSLSYGPPVAGQPRARAWVSRANHYHVSHQHTRYDSPRLSFALAISNSGPPGLLKAPRWGACLGWGV